MFIPAPNVVQVELIYTLFGQSVENVYHVRCNGGFVTADLTAIVNIFDNWNNITQKPTLTGEVGLRLIVARHLNVPQGEAIERAISPVRTGTAGAGCLPGNVTSTITWTTSLRGRSFRGRSYHVGMHPNHRTGNQLTAGAITLFTTTYQTLLNNVNAGGTYNLVVLSKRANNQWRTTAVATAITGINVEGNLDSQRRRLTGPGRGT